MLVPCLLRLRNARAQRSGLAFCVGGQSANAWAMEWGRAAVGGARGGALAIQSRFA